MELYRFTKLMKQIKELLFGVRVKGETLPSPTVKTTDCKNRPKFNDWVKQVNFGARYGTKGSFYKNL